MKQNQQTFQSETVICPSVSWTTTCVSTVRDGCLPRAEEETTQCDDENENKKQTHTHPVNCTSIQAPSPVLSGSMFVFVRPITLVPAWDRTYEQDAVLPRDLLNCSLTE